MIPDNLINVYMDRLINRHDIWGKQYISSDGSCQYACQKPEMNTVGGRYPYEPVTLHLVQRHIIGDITCSWSAIDSEGRSKWLCFDSDTDNGDLDNLEAFLRKYGWHPIREAKRPGRDGHLWLIFDEPVAAEQLIILGDAMMKLAGVKNLERFPKFAVGLSSVRGPLGIHRKPGADNCRGWFEGPEKNVVAQLKWLAAQPLNRAEDARREAEKQREEAQAPRMLRAAYRSKSATRQVTILQLLPERRRVGSEWVAQCPICAAEGHDQHRDNLRISLDGRKFCCWYGGQPGKIHKAREIIKALHCRNSSCSV